MTAAAETTRTGDQDAASQEASSSAGPKIERYT